MTTPELIHKFYTSFGSDPWPSTYEVDAETYANVCQTVFAYGARHQPIAENECLLIKIPIGPNMGILLKNVELILTNQK